MHVALSGIHIFKKQRMPNSYDKYNFDLAEAEFLRILRAAIPPVPNDATGLPQALRSRMTPTTTTPRFEVLLKTGQVTTQKHILNPAKLSQYQASNVWPYELTVNIVTEREQNGDKHAAIVAQVREALQYQNIEQTWSLQVLIPKDTVEQPIQTSVNDAGDEDTTVLTFASFLCIADGAW